LVGLNDSNMWPGDPYHGAGQAHGKSLYNSDLVLGKGRH